MKWLPYAMYEIDPAPASYEVSERLRGVTEFGSVEWNRILPGTGHKPFVGEVDDKAFKIRIRQVVANPLVPVLNGTVLGDGRTSKLSIRVWPTPIAGTFVGAWIVLWVAMGIFAFVRTAVAGRLSPSTGIPLAMGLFFYWVWLLIFHASARRQVDDLRRVVLDSVRPTSNAHPTVGAGSR